MRFCVLVLVLCLLLAPAASAQTTDTQPVDPVALATEVAITLKDAQALADEAANQVDYAFSLLGLLEAFSFVVTIVGGAAAIFGVTRFISAQQDLQAARQRFEEEISEWHERLSSETAQRQQEFADLQASLSKSTGNATLALSYLPLGESQYKSGDFKGALDIYQRALHLDPGNPIINYRLGYAYIQSGMLDEATQHLQDALKREPEFAPALATLGYVYRRSAEKMPENGIERVELLNKAEYNLVRALKISPKLVDDDGESWWGSLGGLYRRRGQIKEAIYAYTEAARVTPSSSYAFSNLALLYMQDRDRDRMLQTYQKVEKLALDEVQAEVNNYWAFTDLVTSRLALGKVEEAQQALQSLFLTVPTDSPYVLEVMLDTLNRLADVLAPDDGLAVQDVIRQIQAHNNQRTANQTAQA